MENPVTDRLMLVETTCFEGLPLLGNITIPWFEQRIPARKGINREVFRGKNYIGSVNSPSIRLGDQRERESAPVKARKGDLIYNVLLTPQLYNFTGFIGTKDGFQRTYEVRLQLQVNNSKRCVECYREGRDPAAMAIGHFKSKFEQYFSRFVYDEIDHIKVSTEKLNKQLDDMCGIIVVHMNWKFYLDLQREKALQIRRNAELRKIEIETEAEVKELEERQKMDRERRQKQFELEEKGKKNDFDRMEKLKQNLNEARIQWLSNTVQELVTINKEQIRDAIDSNVSVRTVLEDHLKLLSVFSGSNPKDGGIVDSNLLNEDILVDGKEEKFGPDTTINLTLSPENKMTDDTNQSSSEP